MNDCSKQRIDDSDDGEKDYTELWSCDSCDNRCAVSPTIGSTISCAARANVTDEEGPGKGDNKAPANDRTAAAELLSPFADDGSKSATKSGIVDTAESVTVRKNKNCDMGDARERVCSDKSLRDDDHNSRCNSTANDGDDDMDSEDDGEDVVFEASISSSELDRHVESKVCNKLVMLTL